MDVFEYADDLEYGELHFKADQQTGLRAIVAIHSLERGPAIGGCRFIEYPTSDDAIRDAMRLGRGMTYKAAITGLPHGGAKSVVIRPLELDDDHREDLFHRFGRFIDGLDGKYVTAEDSGTTVQDMNIIHEETEYVLGWQNENGGAGDPSPYTARGVRRGLEAAVEHVYDRDSLEGIHVAIQGVGHVGYHLAGELHAEGAELTVADVDEQAVERAVDEFGVETVDPDAIYDVDCDIFAPCALGAVLDDDTIPRLKCDIVGGSANNQLADPEVHDRRLAERGILYAPDYAINAGGLIYVARHYAKRNEDVEAAEIEIDGLYEEMLGIYERAESEDEPTGWIADRIAEERFKPDA